MYGLTYTQYDLSLNIETHASGFDISIDFWSSRIDRKSVENVAATFQQAFVGLLKEDNQCLEQVAVVTSDEVDQIREWNRNIPQGVRKRMQDPVYEQRLLRPDAWAIQSWDGDMTYKQVDTAANKLASYLVGLGVQPEVKIPICFEKSKWAAISQLAIFKAGGCVVPLGTNQPMRRVEMILQDIDARIILTMDKFVDKFKGVLPHVVTVDEELISKLPECEAPSCAATSTNAAFIIYTSGSTGVPKGVVLTHGSLCTSVHNLGAKFKLSPETRMIQFSAYTFDISIQDIYATWNYGGCICIIPEDERINNLGPAMRSYEVNAAGLTSTVAGLISPKDVPSLKTLVLLGEAVKPAVVNQWIDHVTVFNAYGPSECSIQASCTEIGPESDPLNIGFAFAGALWVVESKDYNRLAPIGAPGELLIEGPLQAREYLNDEVKTASAFIMDPAWVSEYSFGSGRRFYRTGDLVQQNQDGSITYIGRRDTQIKVRGQRVETGEIEYNLMQHDAVVDAAVLFPVKGPCDNRLVGLLSLCEFVPDNSLGLEIKPVSQEDLPRTKPIIAAVSQYLTAYVPEHMLPSVWIPLAGMMPQNDSAKLDRKRLTQWMEGMDQSLLDTFTSMGGAQESTREPETPLEREVQNAWAEVLKLPHNQVPVEYHSFLDLGGDSLAAMQVASWLRAQGILVMVRTVLESKSVAHLALELDKIRAMDEDPRISQNKQLYLEPTDMPPISIDYWGLEAETNLHGDQISQAILLGEDYTSLLFGEANNARRTEPVDILIAALFDSFHQTFPDRLLPTIFDETHSRDSEADMAVLSSPKWRTTLVPVYVPINSIKSPLDILQRTKESKRSIKTRELPSFDSGLLGQGRETFPSSQQMEVLFKYPGRFGDGVSSSHTHPGVTTSSVPNDNRRFSVFQIEATVSEKKLSVDFQFNRNMKHLDKVHHWVETFNKCLCALVSDLIAASPTLSLSDFPLVSMSSEGLAKLQHTILPKEGINLEDIEDIYPCSPTQQGILMSQLKSPSEYYIQQSIKIKTVQSSSGVNIDGFMDAWQAMVNRHPVLRTVFVESAAVAGEGLFDQVVLKSCRANMEHKFCAETELESNLAVKTNLSADIFENRLGHKLTLYSTPSNHVYAQIIISHALVDASSLVLLQEELVQIYDQRIPADGFGPAFGQFISYLQRTPEDEALQYWSSRLGDADPCYMPSFTSASPPMQRNPDDPVALQHEMATLDVEGLQKFGKSHGVTVANVFQLAWALVLSQYTGSADVSFGYLSSGRDVPVSGVQKMLGPLLNMMVTRVKLDPEVSVGDTVRQIQDDFFSGFNYQRAPLLKIWHALELKGQSLFNTSISYQHALSQNEDESNTILEPIVGEDRTEYDITVNVFVSDKKTTVSLQYSPEFLTPDGAKSLVQCLQQVLRSFAANPNLPIGQVQMVTQEDVQQIRAWNNQTPKTKSDHCIHDIVAYRRSLTPQAPAVCAWDGDLTYEELEDLGDQLAHHLATDLGVGPETMVPLCFDKSLWSIVAQLGVLKAGGAVVSINPKHPVQRLEGILEDIKASVMLTSPEHSSRFIGHISHVLGIDASLFSTLSKQAGPARRTATPENSAFVIYTSGSTGRPKGVILTHRALTASFQGHGNVYGMNPSTRSVQFASYTFDASISDIWGTIYHGGCVCVISEDERMNRLQEAIQSYQGTLAQLTPTVAEMLDVSQLKTLKTLVLGGEPVKSGMVEKLLAARDNLTVLNGYGPSECSIYTTCSAPLKDKNEAPNVGRPLVGGVWLVSNESSVCPIGSVGEIWIEGPLLARGYLNDRQKTDKSFVENPPWARSVGLQGHRFYRTGDLARQTPMGDLIHLGRRDNQVKIRGQRVEIGEIEYAVKKFFPAAKSVLATLVSPSNSSRSPMVSVVIELDDNVQTATMDRFKRILLPSNPSLREAFSQLRTSLTDALPLYMVPRLFVPAIELPQTTSGKLDRRLLRQLLEELSEEQLFQYSLASVDSSTPNTDTERELQSLWAAVLGMNADQIGIHEHFLHFGGDSVTAMRLVSMANGAGISLTVSDIFKYPKLLDMAAHVDSQKVLGQDTEEVPRFSLWKERRGPGESEFSVTERLCQVAEQCGVSKNDIEDVYPCTPLQEGLMAITAQKPHAYIGRWVFRMRDSTDPQQFKQSWESLSTLVPILRTRIVPGRLSGALQVVVSEPISCTEARNLDEYLRIDKQDLFSYGSPLVRAAIIRVTEDERYFVLTAHHSAYDGWSLVRLFKMLSLIYTQQNIPSLPSYTQFIRYLGRQDPTATKAFWVSHLEGGIGSPFPTLPEPSYQPRPTQIKTCRLGIGSMQSSATLASLLRAAWALVVSSFTGENVLLAVALSGRAAPVSGVQDMLAPTITTVPVRVQVDNAQSINGYVAAVHQQAIDMIPFEHTGLQNIRRIVSDVVYPQHLFVVQPAEERNSLSNGRLLTLEPGTNSAQVLDGYALTIECFTGVAGEKFVDVEARFDEKVLSCAQATRLLDRFRHIFDQLLNANTSNTVDLKLVGDIETVSPEEITQLAEWNRDVPAVQQSLVHELVRRQALHQPNADAICSWDGDLSRYELDQLSDRLAHYLVHLGVGPEVMVGLCFDKSKWAVVSMLAILKAGGAVVPVRAQPVQRLEAIIDSTKLKVVLTTPRPESQFTCQVPHVLTVDDSFFSELPKHTQSVKQTVSAQNASFVFHTSGSTGVPKGVVIEHATMSTSLQSHGAKFGMTPKTRAFQFSHLTFDISLHDIITTLQFGGCVCLPSEQERMNNLVGAINRMNVNYTFLPPRVLHTVRPSDIPKVRTVVVGGEAVQAEQIEPWLHEPNTTVFNAYGPAECSIASTCNEVMDKSQASTIGRAIAGALWVVDEADYNRLLPIGAVGELLIEGPLLARGYLNDPQKTSAAFITNPSWLAQYELHSENKVRSNSERRMYRTGDLVQQADDGSLIYVGRRDNQIQIRGQRVEIGEVEHYLLRHPAVVDGVVLYPRDGPSKSRLVGVITLASLVTKCESEPMSEVQATAPESLREVLEHASSIRQSLLGYMPEYMVPDTWISVASMPQNNSDKIDRPKLTKWLESMDTEYFDSITSGLVDGEPKTPESTLERSIRNAYAEILQLPLERVAPNRSFLSIGGDSITAMQVVSLCSAQYGVSLAVQDILQSQSITELAQKAGVGTTDGEEDYAPGSSFELSQPQKLYFETIAPHGLEVSGDNRFNQNVCLVINYKVNVEEVLRGVESLVEKHAMLRSRFIETEQGYKQSIQVDVTGSFQFGVHEARTTEHARELALSAGEHLDIQNGPVFSADLVQRAEDDKQLLFLTAHHLVIDTISWEIIVRDLEHLVRRSGSAGVSKTTSYQTWVQWQSGQDFEAHGTPDKSLPIDTPVVDWEYWGLSPHHNLYADCVREEFVLEEEYTSILFDEVQPLRTDPAELMISALFHSFRKVFPNRPVPTIFNEEHERKSFAPSINLSDTVGLLTTRTPIHIPSDICDPVDLVRWTKDTRRSVSDNRLAYSMSSSSAPTETEPFPSHSYPEVLFNYTSCLQPGTGESLFTIDREFDVSSIGNNVKRRAIFEIQASTRCNRLYINFCFNKRTRSQDAVQLWIRTYHSSLREILEHLSNSSSLCTLSDFSAVNMTYEELSVIQSELLPRANMESLSEVEDIYSCSPVQQGILMSQIKDPNTYYIQEICEVISRGDASTVDLDRLAAAWKSVVARHAILRTVFLQSVSGQDLFYQVVRKHWEPQIHRIHCQDPNDVVPAFARVGRPQYGEGQPQHQLLLCEASTGEAYIQVDVSHALIDASSFGIIIKDFVQAYDRSLSELPAPSYGTYISFLQKSSADVSLAYWSDRLAHAQPCHFPSSPTSASNNRTFKNVTVEFDDMQLLHKFRDTHGVTIANILQLAWAVVVSKYTQSTDVTFGYLANGRDAPIPGIDEMAGPMINLLIAHIQLGAKGVTVAEAAKQVQETFFESFKHQRTSLGDIQHALRLSEQSLFNTTVSYKRQPVESLDDAVGLEIKSILGQGPTEYDLNLDISGGETKMTLLLQYASSFLDDESAKHIMGSLQSALFSIISNDQAPLSEVEVLPESHIEKLQQWNSELPDTVETPIQNQIYQRQFSQSDAQAVCAWDGQLTYNALHLLSDSLAQKLTSLGVREEIMVGLCFEKSKWTIVAMLAVLKAGGVVVPLGVQLPLQRLQFILEDTEAPVVLTTKTHATKFQDISSLHVLTVDESTVSKLPELSRPLSPIKMEAKNAAVVIYTSGSTGQPKGVILTHGSLATSVERHGARLGLGPHTRALQFSAYVFDISLLDIFSTLYFGGCVCVVSEEDRMDINNLPGTMERMGVNFAVLTPTVAGLIEPSTVPTLGTLVLAGEKVQPVNVETWSPYVTVFNGYGPAECSILATINGPLRDRDQAANVGTAVAGALWVVDQDDHNSLVPIGAVGELLIEGPLVAREYLHDYGKTREAFVTHPSFISRHRFGGRRGRMYRTGDLVRQSPTDGSITYVGRGDGQIKIRGQRVEVGEIEHWVKQNLSGVRMAAAALVRAQDGSKQSLLAVAIELLDQERDTPTSPETSFMAVTDTLRDSLVELQESLEQALPSYMVPSLYIPMSNIPLTASGKLDRKSLESILASLSEEHLTTYALAESAEVEPSTETECKLRDLWRSVLPTANNIGANAHFFRSGGDSVTAMRLVALARTTEPPISLNVADIFKHPVLSEMAHVVDERLSDNPSGVEVVDSIPFSLCGGYVNSNPDTLAPIALKCNVAAEAIEDIYPCTPLQEGLMAITAQQPLAYINRWVFRMEDSVDINAFKTAWEQVFDRATIMRTRILQDSSFGAMQVVVREKMKWTELSLDLESYQAQDTAKPMGFGTPLMRFAIISGSSEQFFVWTAHHSVYDGWASSKLLEAVSKLYLEQTAPSFVPYTRFIQYLQQTSSSDAKKYWRSQLEGAMGLSFPAPPKHHQPGLPQRMTYRITGGSAKNGITMATLLRSTWALILSRETENLDVVFPTTLSGRSASVTDILDIVAPTITTVPVRISIDQAQKLSEYLMMVQQQSVDMIPFEHTGLQNIRSITQKSFDFQHLFVIQPSSEGPDKAFPGLQLLSLEAEEYTGYPLVVVCNTALENKNNIIDFDVRFDQSLLSSEKIQSLLEQFEHIFYQLQEATTASHQASDQLVGDVDFVTSRDVARIRNWNQCGQEAERANACVHDLVYEQLLLRPGAPAVCSWDGDLSYQQLDQLASRLANHLSEDLGVGPEIPVVLVFEKTKWAVVSKLAILKAGGVIVPVNHQHPSQRIQAVAEAVGTNVILTSLNTPKLHGLAPNVVVVNEQRLAQLPDAGVSTNRVASPTDSAYIIFTSGSTGIPKGVVLEHGSIVSSMRAQGSHLAGPETRTLQFSAFNFDVSIGEVFTTLIFGGCVCMVSEEDRMDNLAGAMESVNVNLAFLTPTVASLMKPEEVPELEKLVFLGEALRPEVAVPWINKQVQLFNGYGPAESSILTTINRVTDISQAPNIGTALAGGKLWVTDSTNYHQLVPVGTIGELLIEGPLLARGYLEDEDKTATSFVSDPHWCRRPEFSSTSTRRFYRTGDLVRQNLDGSLVYIGRRDTQVKINGQRVEIGEIEYWVKEKLPTVQEVAVGLVDMKELDGAGSQGKVLAAAMEIQETDGSHVLHQEVGSLKLLQVSDVLQRTFAQLRTSLLEVLPPYMVPQLFLPVVGLPLTDSGKLDRRVTWAAAQQLHSLSQYFLVDEVKVPPSTAMELTLQKLWAATLHIPVSSIGARDDFFRSGGDSISAMRLVSKVREHGGLSLSVADIFRSPMLSELAAIADQKVGKNIEALATYEPFSTVDVTAPADSLKDTLGPLLSTSGVIVDAAPTTDFQAHSVMASLRKSRDLLAYVSIDGDGIPDITRWKESCLELIRQHEALRTAYVFHEEQLLQVVLEEYRPEIVHYETEKTTIDQFTKQLMAQDMHRQPQLGRPFVEFAIVTSVSDLRHRIVLRLSHAEYDGISMSYFMDTLQAIYERQPVAADYVPFSRYMHHLLRQDKEDSRQYWRSLLQDSIMPNIATESDVPPQRPAKLVHHSTRSVRITQELPSGITMSTIIRAAWALVLGHHTDSRDVVFGEVVSGRNTGDPVAEKAAGCCINAVPTRATFEESWTVSEFLSYLQKQQVDRLPHETLGFREILRSCSSMPPSTHFSSQVNHRHETPGWKLNIGSVDYNISIALPDSAEDLSDIDITSFMQADHVEITLGRLEGAISPQLADVLMNRLCVAVGAFLNGSRDSVLGSVVLDWMSRGNVEM